ncbi:hypothetical protein Poli38472_000109 [Pythium oligandrum]|uniref:Ankyrin repeat-containing domain n=1 Tax=Pythium oligandrum TaxID=41045 RepID=A0A8K1CBC9_PYTOL|nr:hypothetical protein Poli38472_000109 [Pythium oligandrum]|eukprot:TMW60067.1 hypothetical protein Poli38472_000109 [Pythium oligandrum]
MMWTVNGSVPFFCVRDPKARKGVVFVNGSDVVKSSGSLISKPDALVFAVHIGDLDLLQRISEDKDASRDTNIPKAATLAARLGRLDILQWLYTQRVGNLPVQALYEAARSGRLDVIEWVVACGRTESFDPDILLLAGVASASQQLVEWVCDLFPLTKLTTEPSRLSKSAPAVAYWEDLKDTKVVEVLEWLCVNDRAQPSWWLIEMACRAGKLSFLRDLIKDVHVDEMMASSLIQGLNEACLRGHLEVVVYLTEEMGMLCREGFESAMSQGHRGVAEYLLRMNPQHCPPLSSTTALRMVYDGHVDLVEWEYSTGRMQCLDGMWRCEVERVFRTESLRDSISRYRSVEVNDLRRMRVVAQWLLSHETFGADMVYFVARWAAQRCQTDLFRLAITTIKSRYLYCATYPKWRLPFDIGRLLDLVIEYTTLGDIAQMLLELYPPAISPRVIQWAIECEQTEILQRWGEKVPPPTLAIPPTSPRNVVYRRREEDQSDRITTRVAVCVAVWGVVGYFVYSA